MPSIDVAMARSLRGSTWEVLKNVVARSIAAELSRRGVVDDATNKADDIATTFSSWDNCMEKAYCNCCQCLKCCGDCCGCCDPPGGHKQKHLDDHYAPTTNHAYRSEPPMNPTFPPASGAQSSGIQSTAPQFAASAHHVRNEPPQYAEFETSNKRDSDALPEMPSWQGAGSKKVALDDDVEMDQLKKSPVPDQKSTFMNNGTPSAMPQGRSPYGQQQGNHSGYFDSNGQSPDPYSPIDKGYGYNSNPGDGYGHDQSYAAVGMGAQAQNAYGQTPINQGYGQPHNDYGNHDGYSNAAQGYDMRHSPAPRGTPAPQNDYDGYGVQIPHSRSPVHQNAYDEHNQQTRRTPAPQEDYGYGQAARRTPAPQDNYGYDQPARRTPAPQGDYSYDQSARRTPAPQGDNDYGQPARRTPAPQDEFGYGHHAAYNNQGTHSPAPEPHYGPRPVPQRQYVQQDPPQSPINNNSGFDFNSGYARPQQSPKESYPGYKAYQP
ncbi:hypothetical protein EDB81DRAFT_753212 [Dactylonectria macrodidyma]|uniref:Uncharacterized protein n=1 Tax=Dactylonectria macrodidyma TaxID=307937 RepID=A0A9P9FRQ3_9HYPO|nr:hypothetical protein EDB81DRAFT_753212 [Dactylonectria macrodidyma]